MLSALVFIAQFMGALLKWLAILIVVAVGLGLLFWAVPLALTYLQYIPRPFSDFVVIALVVTIVKVVLKR